MKAITLQQPHAAEVVYFGKNVENRTWPPPESIIGHRIAIHAGLTVDQAALLKIRCKHYLPERRLVTGAVVAVATVSEYGEYPENEWWIPGQIGWKLAEIIALKQPVPATGHQRVWQLPHAVNRAVEAVLAKGRMS